MQNDFRGQVKISDVKEKFDSLVNEINNAIGIYNNRILDSGNIDFNIGSDKLAPKGYSLSVGGLKTILKAYSGYCIGADVYKVNDTTLVVTNGLFFKPTDEEHGIPEIITLPYKIINGVSKSSNQNLFYSVDTNDYMIMNNQRYSNSVVINGNTYINLSLLNLNRSIKYCNTREFENEGINKYHVYVGDNGTNYPTNQSFNASNAPRFAGYDCSTGSNGTESRAQLFGVQVGRWRRNGDRNSKIFCTQPYLFVPKGLPYPYVLTKVADSETRVRSTACNFEWDSNES